MEGAGAFVCGEETALMASIEGKRGMASPKPPFPAQKGLYGKPTVINNVETLASVPIIFKMGVDEFKETGGNDGKIEEYKEEKESHLSATTVNFSASPTQK